MSLECVNRDTNLDPEPSERKSKSINHLDQSDKASSKKKEVIKRGYENQYLFKRNSLEVNYGLKR